MDARLVYLRVFHQTDGVGIVYAEIRLSNFSQPELEEISVNALVDSGALDLIIPEHLAIQLRLSDLKPREVHLADGSRKLARYAGPIKVEMMGRDCVTAAVVMGDQVLLGAIPMQAMDVIVHPRTERVVRKFRGSIAVMSRIHPMVRARRETRRARRRAAATCP